MYFLYRVLCNCLSDLWHEISLNNQFVDRSHGKTHQCLLLVLKARVLSQFLLALALVDISGDCETLLQFLVLLDHSIPKVLCAEFAVVSPEVIYWDHLCRNRILLSIHFEMVHLLQLWITNSPAVGNDLRNRPKQPITVSKASK